MLNGWLRTMFDARGPLAMLSAAVIGAVLLPALTRMLLDHAPLYDELLHMLSARGVIATGEPVIDSGTYPRAELFTRSVAVALERLGDNPVAARLPALLSGMLLIGLIGAWTCRHAGWLAGTAAGVLLAMAPSSISLSVLARFYTMHGLVVAVMLIALYEALAPGRSRATVIGLAVLALLLLPLGLHLQATTVISAGAGVIAVLAVTLVERWATIGPVLAKRPLVSSASVVGVTAVGLLATWQLGLIEQFGATPLWAADRSDRIGYYNSNLVLDMPLLWPLLPLAALTTIVGHRRLGVFCSVLVLTALIVHSIAAQKAVRYFYHVLPFVCVLWGYGFRQAVLVLAGAVERFAPVLRSGSVAAAFLLAAFGIANSQEGQRTVKLVLGRGDPADVIGYAAEADWSLALPQLEAFVGSADRVVVSSSVKGLYVLGRYDYELNASVVLETETGTEFGRDPRTGRQAIGTAASVGEVLAEPGSALVVIENEKLNNPSGAPEDAIELIESHCTAIEVPPASQLAAWTC